MTDSNSARTSSRSDMSAPADAVAWSIRNSDNQLTPLGWRPMPELYALALHLADGWRFVFAYESDKDEQP